jgi:hypothetical protein
MQSKKIIGTIRVEIITESLAINGLSNERIDFEVGENTTVGSVRKRLKDELGLPNINCIAFIYCGNPIADDVDTNCILGDHGSQQIVHAVLSGIDASFVHTSAILQKKQADRQKTKVQQEKEQIKKNRSELAELKTKAEQLQKTVDDQEKSIRKLVFSGIDVNDVQVLNKTRAEGQRKEKTFNNSKDELTKVKIEVEKSEEALENKIKPREESLFSAICENNVKLFNETFEKFPNKTDILDLRLEWKDRNRNAFSATALFEAAKSGSIEIVKKLLEIPEIAIDEKVLTMHYIPAVCPEINQTPLGIAIQNGYLDVVKLLLSKGANPDCFHWGSSPNVQVTNVVDMYKYRANIKEELHSWVYQNITLPVKKHSDFFKEHFKQDKADKLQVANLIIDVLEGKKDASVLTQLDDKQTLAINDGRLKVAFEAIKPQLPKATDVTKALQRS